MDKQAVWKIFKYQAGKYAVLHSVCTAAAFLLAFVGIFAAVLIAKDDTYINIATFTAGLIYIFMGFIFCVISFTTGFTNTVKMSIGRVNYIAGTVLYHLLSAVAGMGFTAISVFEIEAAKNLYGARSVAKPMLESLFADALPLFGMFSAVIALGIFIGAVILKFGVKGLMALYFTLIIGINIFSMYFKRIAEVLLSIEVFNSFMGLDSTIRLTIAVLAGLTVLIFCLRVLLKNDLPA